MVYKRQDHGKKVFDLFYTITNSNEYLSKAMPDREETLPGGRKDSRHVKTTIIQKKMNMNSKKNTFNYLLFR